MKIYIQHPLSDEERRRIGQMAAGDEVWIAADPPGEADRRAFLEAEVVFGAFPRDLVLRAPRLRWIQLPAAGVDTFAEIDWSQVAGRVICTNLKGVFGEPMAQSVLAYILSHYRNVAEVSRLQVARDWQKDALHARGRILRGARVVLLGAGSIAGRLRNLMAPFNCSFTVYARHSGDIHTREELDAALSTADIVCSALPHTADTQGLFDAARIARMQPTTLFINVGRGSLVDESALIEALTAGRLGAAVIDVTRREPVPPGDPLWTCPHLLLTQHTSAGSGLERVHSLEFFGDNLARYRSGEPLLNIVDWKKGY